MDSSQLGELRRIIRAAIADDLDELFARLDQLEDRTVPAGDLGRRLAAVETLNGIRPRPAGQAERQAQVKQLHAQGLSQRMIAATLGVNRSAVAADMRGLGLEPSPDSVGADGRRLGRMAERSNGRRQ